MSTRELTRFLTEDEVSVAHGLCLARAMSKVAEHQYRQKGCSLCRTEVLRLVDEGVTPSAPPRERTFDLLDAPPLPEIREEDVTNVVTQERYWHSEALKKIAGQDRHRALAASWSRILSVLEAVSARKGGGK